MDHKFDIIVQALSATVLSENASADYHDEDTYFGSSDKYLLKNGTVDKLWIIYEDYNENYDTLDADESPDDFIVAGYEENNEGVIVPVLYKADMDAEEKGEYYGIPDYQEIFYYVGTIVDQDGVECDRWRKIQPEGGEGAIFTWNATAKQYWLTNRIVTDGKFNDGILGTFDRPVNLSTWELKYSLDNDTERFAWATSDNDYQEIINLETGFSNGSPIVRQPGYDGYHEVAADLGYYYAWGSVADREDGDYTNFIYTKNEILQNGEKVFSELHAEVYPEVQVITHSGGKGVIYYMKDEWNNECPYDFKNIQFKRDISWQEEHEDLLTNLGIGIDDCNWFYTFCAVDQNYEPKDLTVGNSFLNDDPRPVLTRGNKIENYYSSVDPLKADQLTLNNIIIIASYFYDNGIYSDTYNNIFKNGCHEITLISGSENNKFDCSCYNIVAYDVCHANTIGSRCRDINIEIPTEYLTIGKGCGNIAICGNANAYAANVSIENVLYPLKRGFEIESDTTYSRNIKYVILD